MTEYVPINPTHLNGENLKHGLVIPLSSFSLTLACGCKYMHKYIYAAS